MLIENICNFSERFLVKLNKNGGPQNPEKVDRLCTLFMVRKHLIGNVWMYVYQMSELFSKKKKLS